MTTNSRTLHRQFIAVISVLLLTICFLKPCSADPHQAFLKINQYYVLFTNPIVPCIDKNGNFIVGLQGFSSLLGAKVLLAGGSTTVRLGDDSIKFVRASKTAYINGKAVRMAEVPQERPTLQSATLPLPEISPGGMVGPATQMLVPIKILVHAFHLRSSWQAKTRTLLLERTGLALSVESSILVENITRFERPFLGSENFVPISLALRSDTLPSYKLLGSAAKSSDMKLLELTVKNTSHQDFSEGQAYINIISIGGESHGMPMPSVDIPNIPPAALKVGATRLDMTEINGPNSHFVSCVVAWLLVEDFNRSP